MPEISPQNPPWTSVGKEGVMLIGDPFIRWPDPADQFREYLAATIQYHQPACEE